jgi:hypothetical protein
MPVYQFHALPDQGATPLKVVLFSDAAAGRIALGPQFPEGCDVYQGARYVGRFHRGKGEARGDESAEGVGALRA